MLSSVDWVLKKTEHSKCLETAQAVNLSQSSDAVIGQHQRLQIGQARPCAISHAADTVVTKQKHA